MENPVNLTESLLINLWQSIALRAIPAFVQNVNWVAILQSHVKLSEEN